MGLLGNVYDKYSNLNVAV